MKLAQVIALAAAGGFLATDKKPEDLLAHVLAEDKKAKDKPAYDRARDEAEEAEDAMGEACDSKAGAMDSAEEKEDEGKGEDKAAKDRKAARDARKAARDSRKAARDSRKAARDKRAKDANTDPERTNDNELENAETGTPSKGGESKSGAVDSADVDRRIAAAVAASVAARDELHTASREVEPIVGVRAFDSAGDAYKAALEHLGVDVAGVPPSAYRALLKLAKDKHAAAPPSFALDAASQADIAAKIPHLNRL
jgi:hypothetical protein